MKMILLLALLSTSAFAGGVNGGGSAGGTAGGGSTGTDTKPVKVADYKEDEADLIDSGKRCLQAYNPNYQFETAVTVSGLKKAITDEITKPKKSIGRSIASVSETPKIESMECNLFARDVGDREFINIVTPMDTPALNSASDKNLPATKSISR